MPLVDSRAAVVSRGQGRARPGHTRRFLGVTSKTWMPATKRGHDGEGSTPASPSSLLPHLLCSFAVICACANIRPKAVSSFRCNQAVASPVMKLIRSAGVFEFPHTATTLLLAINILVYALTLQRSGTPDPTADTLFRSGAIYSGALVNHEYWRLVAYAFLHANLLHILTNMVCLVWWGGPLEKRVGTAYFLLIYFASVIGGALTGFLTSPGVYFAVGASAGISGVLGALLCLKALRRVDLPASFFVINIGLNVVIAFMAPRVDWRAHLGGIVAGMAVCAGL